MTNEDLPIYAIDDHPPYSSFTPTFQIVFSYPSNDPIFLMTSTGSIIFTESGMKRYRAMECAYSTKFNQLIKELNDMRYRLRKMVCLATTINTFIVKKLKECEESLKNDQLVGLELLPQLYRNCIDSTRNYIERYDNQQEVVSTKGFPFHELMTMLTEIERSLVKNLEECNNLRDEFDVLIEVWK